MTAKKTGTDIEPVKYVLPPALVNTPALDLDGTSVTLPRVKIAHTSSVAFQEGNVAFGDLYSACGKEDPDPVILRPGKAAAGTDGILFHVLSVKRGWSGKDADGKFDTWKFNDTTRPADARETFDYQVCLPEVDPDLPYGFIMSSSASGPAAKQINMLLIKNQERGPAYLLAFRCTTKFRENPKGKFYSLVVKQEEAKPENIAAAEALAILVATAPAQLDDSPSTADTQPAI